MCVYTIFDDWELCRSQHSAAVKSRNDECSGKKPVSQFVSLDLLEQAQ